MRNYDFAKFAKDAKFSTQSQWASAVKQKYPGCNVKWDGNRTYIATVEGNEVGRFNYGDIRGGNMERGQGWVD